MHARKSVAILLVGALVGCGGGKADPSIASAGKDEAPSSPVDTIDLPTGELRNYHIATGIGDRQYSLFKPLNPRREKLPLVVWFHGAGGKVWPGIQFDYWVALAGREKFYLLQPQAVSDQYVTYTYWNSGLGPHRDDAQFVRTVLDAVLAANDIDTDSIYIGGMSSGGHMAFYMAQVLNNRIAAVAPIAGSIAHSPNVLGSYKLGKPTPLVHIYGTGDTIVRIDGGDWYASWASIRSTWLRENLISDAPSIVELADSNRNDGTTVTKFSYRGKTPASDIDDYRINGGGHSIPGVEPGANQDFNAFEVIWIFFQKHKLSERN